MMAHSKSGLWVSDPEAYRKKMEDLVGTHDPLDILTQTSETLSGIVGEHSADAMQTRPFPEKWTPNEIIGHLVDAEWVYGFRVRLVSCEDRPTILGMDQDLWVARLRHNERTPSELVEMFAAMRRFNLSVWKRLGPEDLQRVGQHNERGPESLGTMLLMCAGHDLIHLDQIRRYLAAVKA